MRSSSVGVGLADDHPATRFDDPRLLAGDVLERRTEHLGVVVADVGQHGHVGVDDVGRSPSGPRGRPRPPPRRPASSANQAKAAAVSSSKRVGRSFISGLERAPATPSTSTKDVVVDGLAVPGEALVDPAQVGARVGADGETLLGQSSAVAIAAVDPLPLVPVMCNAGYARSGSPRRCHQLAHAIEGGQGAPRWASTPRSRCASRATSRASGKVVEAHGARRRSWSAAARRTQPVTGCRHRASGR